MTTPTARKRPRATKLTSADIRLGPMIMDRTSPFYGQHAFRYNWVRGKKNGHETAYVWDVKGALDLLERWNQLAKITAGELWVYAPGWPFLD